MRAIACDCAWANAARCLPRRNDGSRCWTECCKRAGSSASQPAVTSAEGLMADRNCQCPRSHATLSRTARCLSQKPAATDRPCTLRPTNATQVTLAGFECAHNDVVALRGFFVISRDGVGNPVCTTGDAFHLWMVEDGELALCRALTANRFYGTTYGLAKHQCSLDA